MLSLDRAALFCDLAETYGIRDPGSLDAKTTATLAAGLRDDARIRRKATGHNHTTDTLLLAIIADGINALIWKAGMYEEKPESLLDILTSGPKAEEEKTKKRKFKTREEFMEARAEILRKYKKGD